MQLAWGGAHAMMHQIPEIDPVRLEILEGQVARVTLDRAAARNAINGRLARQLEGVVGLIEDNPAVRVVILTGAGRGFCAGADLAEVAAGQEAALWTERGGFAGFVRHPRTKPWIAAVHGFALAGGLEIALACDLIVASDDAVFGLPEVRRGLVAGAGGLFRLPRAIPRNLATEIILTGDSFGAAKAAEWGLVNRLVPFAQVQETALDLARRIALNAPLALIEVCRFSGRRPISGRPTSWPCRTRHWRA
ncbi:enoyl-CoA hydratase/isomerase family protein [Micromonospora sp. STR1s_5]|nr:enoyl-CoA hydratase/isomerase family protein [Micromonospora sp. STR1s_5]